MELEVKKGSGEVGGAQKKIISDVSTVNLGRHPCMHDILRKFRLITRLGVEIFERFLRFVCLIIIRARIVVEFFFIRSQNWCKCRRWTLNLTWKEGGEAADVIFTHKCLFLSLERSEIQIFPNGGKWRILVRNNFRIFSA